MSSENGADVSLKVAGQEVNVRNVKSLNTGIAMLNCSLLCGLLVGGVFHEVGARDDKKAVAEALVESQKIAALASREANKALVDAIDRQANEQRRATEAVKEGNCLLALPQDRRVNAADVCKRTARDYR